MSLTVIVNIIVLYCAAVDEYYIVLRPELQKHYASIQALALGEENLEFDEAKDTTLPDEEGFAAADVKVILRNHFHTCSVLGSDVRLSSFVTGRDRLI